MVELADLQAGGVFELFYPSLEAWELDGAEDVLDGPHHGCWQLTQPIKTKAWHPNGVAKYGKQVELPKTQAFNRRLLLVSSGLPICWQSLNCPSGT